MTQNPMAEDPPAAAWFDETLQGLAAAAEGWWALDAAASRDDLAAALNGLLDVYVGHGALMAAINEEATQSEELRTALSGAIQCGIDRLRTHIERGQAEGFVDPDLPAPETAAWLVWLIEGGSNRVLGRADPEQSALLRSNLTSMIWNVLYAGSRAHL